MQRRRAVTPVNSLGIVATIAAVLSAPVASAGGAGPQDPAANAPLALGEHTAELNGLKLWYRVSGSGPVCVMQTPG